MTLTSLPFIRKLRLDRLTTAFFIVPVVLFFVLTMKDKAQAGIRYFLPIYPLLMSLCGATVVYLWNRGRSALRWVIVFLLVWHVLEPLSVYPHYLAYFHQWVGGPSRGYKALWDSNLDLGQGLKALSEFVNKGQYPGVVLYYPWPADPAYYRINFRQITDDEMEQPRNEIYAISAHVVDNIKWARQMEPTALAGYSILIYDMRERNRGSYER